MAWAKSGIYVHTIQEMFRNTTPTPASSLDFRLATGKIALGNASMVDGAAPINFSAATVSWASTNEVTGTGWATGGIVLNVAAAGGTSTVPTIAEGTAGSLRYNMGSISVASTTLSGVVGCIIYQDSITAPADLVKAMLVAVAFGAPFSTTAGTFAIAWSGTGICEIDVTP